MVASRLPPLPPDLVSHVLDLSSLCSDLMPRRRGCTSACFFKPGPVLPVLPSVGESPRDATKQLPVSLARVYAKYAPDTEFCVGDSDSPLSRWTFLSELEIEERKQDAIRCGQARLVDLAIAYAGMGHVHVLSMDPATGTVFQRMDGGGNGWEREANAKARCSLDVETVQRQPFDEWWKGEMTVQCVDQ